MSRLNHCVAWLSGLGFCLASAASAEPVAVAISFLGSPDSAEARGAALGVEEANRQGRYFGFHFELRAESQPSQPLVIAALSAKALRGVSLPGRVVMNVAAADDSLRTPCNASLFHVTASDTMRSNALDAWLSRTGKERSGLRVVGWHESLFRYAARDLNARYRQAHDEPMASASWAGWAGARILGEAVIRTGSAGSSGLAAFLHDELGFDGQKGAALRFGRDRQLAQPLYFMREGTVLGENSADSTVSATPDDCDVEAPAH